MIRTVATPITKRHTAWQHQHQTHQGTQKCLLGFLGGFHAYQYTLKQPHGSFSLSVEGGYSTFVDYDPCGDPFLNENCPQY
jgi:hypothetical protein